jgi:hypothetical protein
MGEKRDTSGKQVRPKTAPLGKREVFAASQGGSGYCTRRAGLDGRTGVEAGDPSVPQPDRTHEGCMVLLPPAHPG